MELSVQSPGGLAEINPAKTMFPALLGEPLLRIAPLKDSQSLIRACMRADASTAWAIVTSHPELLDNPSDELRQLPVAAAAAGKLDSVRLMALLGFELRWEAAEGGTALHHAARYGLAPMVRLLLELGAPVNIRDSHNGSSPLGWAAAGSRLCRPGADEEYCIVIRMLLTAGATRDAAINRWNETPEELASRRVQALFKTLGFIPT
jgi:ankyrin repeat protein